MSVAAATTCTCITASLTDIKAARILSDMSRVNHALFPDVFDSYDTERSVLAKFKLSHSPKAQTLSVEQHRERFILYIEDLLNAKDSVCFTDLWTLPYLRKCPACMEPAEPYVCEPTSIQVCRNKHFSWPSNSQVTTETDLQPPYVCRGRFYGKDQLLQQAKNRASAAVYILSMLRPDTKPMDSHKRRKTSEV